MKFLSRYLKVTSVMFHMALLASLYWVLPYYGNVQESFKTGINSMGVPTEVLQGDNNATKNTS